MKRIVIMINSKTGDAIRISTKEEFNTFKEADYKPVVLRVG